MCDICQGNEVYTIEQFDEGDVKWREYKQICWDCRLKNNPTKYVGIIIGRTWHQDRGKGTIWVNTYLVGKRGKSGSFTFFLSTNPYSTTLFATKSAEEAAEKFAKISLDLEMINNVDKAKTHFNPS